MYGKFDARNENIARRDTPVRILIVEDQDRLAVANILRSMEYSLEIAGNGKEAVNKLENGRFDLILMDIHMPVTDGIEATWIIRNHESYRGDYTPIVACLSDASKEDPSVFSCPGFDGFINKPIVFKELMQEIHRCTHFKRLRPA